MKRERYELGPTVYDRLDSIRMTAEEREAAIDAMRNAYLIVDACAWVVARIRQLGGLLSHKPTAAH